MKMFSSLICTGFVVGGLSFASPLLAADHNSFWQQLRPASDLAAPVPAKMMPAQVLNAGMKSHNMASSGSAFIAAAGVQNNDLSGGGFASDAIEFEFVAGWDSEHVFRGTQQSKQNITGGIEARMDQVYAGVWAVLPTADSFAAYQDRIDVYAGYGFALSDGAWADIGVTGYIRPDNGLLFSYEDSVEVFAGVSGSGPFSPALYGFYDFVLEQATIEASAEYIVPVGRTDLVFGGTAGYSNGSSLDYGYVQADVELAHNFNRNTAVSLGGHFAASTEPTFLQGLALTSERTSWFGVRLRTAR